LDSAAHQNYSPQALPGHDVTVDIHGGSVGGVAEELLHVPRRRAAGEHDRGEGMPEVVKAQARGKDACCFYRPPVFVMPSLPGEWLVPVALECKFSRFFF